MIEDLAKLIPQDLLVKSGSVFCSGRNAFRATAPLYILGLNPGGDPEAQQEETIAAHTRAVLAYPDDWCAYRDEAWRNDAPGTSGMQPRVLHLLARLSLRPGDVPSSNVVFLRTRDERSLGTGFRQLAEACWPFHEAAIARLKPRVILCFGRTAGDYVRSRMRANHPDGEFVEANNRRWRSRAFRNDAGIVVVAATHPSRANWVSPDSDPSHLIQAVLAQDA